MADVYTPKQTLLVHLSNPRIGKSELEKDITEIWNLAQTLGDIAIVDLIVQKGLPFRTTYIGPGKAEEVHAYVRDHPIDILLVGGILTPNQKFNLTRMCWDTRPTIQVWDRVDLILEIFSRHAHTTEANLQIDLARMHHMGPTIYGMGKILSRQGGGVGTRGIGETNTERMKRHWRKEIHHVTEELAALQRNRQKQIDNRKQNGIHSISLVGYTNAGKTSLFNLLTHKKQIVRDDLFVTLDSVVGEVYVPTLGKMVVSDTIGFIKDLPPDLIEAFQSTLLESIHADVVVHVVDIADPDITEKIRAVDTILDQLAIPPEKIIVAGNKSDVVGQNDTEKIRTSLYPYPLVLISAKMKTGIDDLLDAIIRKLHV